jgi:hypothetical protein
MSIGALCTRIALVSLKRENQMSQFTKMRPQKKDNLLRYFSYACMLLLVSVIAVCAMQIKQLKIAKGKHQEDQQLKVDIARLQKENWDLRMSLLDTQQKVVNLKKAKTQAAAAKLKAEPVEVIQKPAPRVERKIADVKRPRKKIKIIQISFDETSKPETAKSKAQ